MYKKISKDNAIFSSPEFQKDKYKFNLVELILEGDNLKLYSDEENYIFCRGEQGNPTWIWTKDGITDSKILNEIIDLMNVYLTDLEKDKFTCKKEIYDFLVKSGYSKINPEDYFEMGFLLCSQTKTVKSTDGYMKLADEEDIDTISKFLFDFYTFLSSTQSSIEKISMEDAKKEAKELIEAKRLFVWQNKDGKIVCIASYRKTNNTSKITDVYTLPEERGKGYAANIIHDMTDKMLAEGLTPLLYTDYHYSPSNKAYINAGYEDMGILINFSCSKNRKITNENM